MTQTNNTPIETKPVKTTTETKPVETTTETKPVETTTVTDKSSEKQQEENKTPAVIEQKVKVLMPTKYKEFLKNLYLLRSYSGFEDPMRRAIMETLDELNIPYINFNGNILGFNYPGAPLFSAHMDMVNTDSYKLQKSECSLNDEHKFTLDTQACIRLYKDAEKKNQTSLGADDKNGIWTILMLLAHKRKINFAFCHSEETGRNGSRQIVADKELAGFISSCPYCIVVDRRNAHDIIGFDNKYCLRLDEELAKFSAENGFKFKEATGTLSDADSFADYIECVNISCGYYDAHTSHEYTNLNELWNTFLFCIAIVDKFKYTSASSKRLKEFRKTTYSYSSKYSYSSYSSKNTKSSYDDYWDNDVFPYSNRTYITNTDTNKSVVKSSKDVTDKEAAITVLSSKKKLRKRKHR